MQLSKAAEGFILYANSGVYAPTYATTLQARLRVIVNYFQDPELNDLHPEDWQRFMGYLATEYQPKRIDGQVAHITESTRDGYWKLIRSFYNWAVDSSILSSERPDLRLQRPKYDTPQIIPFTQEEVKRLLDACQFTQVQKQSGRTYRIKRPNADRDRAILMILLDTGVRLGELHRLRVGDINLENGEIYVRPHRSGRKSKSRTVYIGARTKQAVWKYIAKAQAQPDLSAPLFEIQYSYIRHIIRRIGHNARVPGAHPHKFRHTFAIMYLRNHGDVFTLQRLLGHSTLEMTQKYVHIVKADLASAHRAASPVDMWKL